MNPKLHLENPTEQGFFRKTQEYNGHVLLYEEDEYFSNQMAKHPSPDVITPERIHGFVRVWLTRDGRVDYIEAGIEPTKGRMSANDVLAEVSKWN